MPWLLLKRIGVTFSAMENWLVFGNRVLTTEVHRYVVIVWVLVEDIVVGIAGGGVVLH